MKKQPDYRSLILLPLLALVLFACALNASAQEEPQEQTEYKVGDRVEVDPQAYALTYKFKKWHKATVTKVGPSGGGVFGYYIRIDAEGDSGAQDNYVMTGSHMIRPLQEVEKTEANKGAGDQEKQGPEKKAEAEPEQPAATNGCQPSEETGGATQTDIFKHLVQDRYLHKPDSEQDFTATVTFQTFKLGATHKWRPGIGGESPDGPGGRAGTTIFPVKAVYTVCKDHPGYAPSGYRGVIEKRQDNNNFYCFKNQFSEWQCNLGEGTMGKTVSTTK